MANPLAIAPQELPGPWTKGYALDFHTLSSRHIGDNEYGHPVFETQRTAVGETLYQLKYHSDRSCVPALADAAHRFLAGRKWKLDAIVPVPPSNTRRSIQPVGEVANALGRLSGLPVCHQCIRKAKGTTPMKNVFDHGERARLLAGVFRVDGRLTAGRRLLLLDDLYRSGATASTLARLLKEKGRAAAVFFLALTRTRRHA